MFSAKKRSGPLSAMKPVAGRCFVRMCSGANQYLHPRKKQWAPHRGLKALSAAVLESLTCAMLSVSSHVRRREPICCSLALHRTHSSKAVDLAWGTTAPTWPRGRRCRRSTAAARRVRESTSRTREGRAQGSPAAGGGSQRGSQRRHQEGASGRTSNWKIKLSAGRHARVDASYAKRLCRAYPADHRVLWFISQ